MISICIPIYNFDVTKLVNDLSFLSKKTEIPFEIILIDDYSSEYFRKINEKTCSEHTYIKLDANVGRAKIRNLFINYIKFEYLLFLDCDAVLISDNFIKNYYDFIQISDCDVICGGRIYDNSQPDKNKMLRWKYGIIKESQPVKIRQISPNKSFMTNNFVIKKQLFNEIKFDERLKNYGHEDSLFGYELKKRKITISHIKNPILNGDIEDNDDFLNKTEKGIKNLIYILQFVENDINFINDISLLKFYNQIKKVYLINFVYLIFLCSKNLIKRQLLKGNINLKIFDFYKLGILIQSTKQFSKF